MGSVAAGQKQTYVGRRVKQQGPGIGTGKSELRELTHRGERDKGLSGERAALRGHWRLGLGMRASGDSRLRRGH